MKEDRSWEQAAADAVLDKAQEASKRVIADAALRTVLRKHLAQALLAAYQMGELHLGITPLPSR